MSATMTAPAPANDLAKTPSRPALLTLTGLYQTSKSVYVSYMPEAASKTVESLAEKILSVSSPYVASIHKSLPQADEKPAVPQKNECLELNVAKLDALVASLCSQADAKVDDLITTSSSRLSSARAKVQCAVETKTDAVKAVVHETLGCDRVVAFQERCTDVYGDLTTAASSCYSTAQEYTPAARHVAIQYGQIVQSEVKTKGVITTAHVALTWAWDQAATAWTILREQGLVAGFKIVGGAILTTVASTLNEAKCEAVTPVLDDQDDAEDDGIASADEGTSTPPQKPFEDEKEKATSDDEEVDYN